MMFRMYLTNKNYGEDVLNFGKLKLKNVGFGCC